MACGGSPPPFQNSAAPLTHHERSPASHDTSSPVGQVRPPSAGPGAFAYFLPHHLAAFAASELNKKGACITPCPEIHRSSNALQNLVPRPLRRLRIPRLRRNLPNPGYTPAGSRRNRTIPQRLRQSLKHFRERLAQRLVRVPQQPLNSVLPVLVQPPHRRRDKIVRRRLHVPEISATHHSASDPDAATTPDVAHPARREIVPRAGEFLRQRIPSVAHRRFHVRPHLAAYEFQRLGRTLLQRGEQLPRRLAEFLRALSIKFRVAVLNCSSCCDEPPRAPFQTKPPQPAPPVPPAISRAPKPLPPLLPLACVPFQMLALCSANVPTNFCAASSVLPKMSRPHSPALVPPEPAVAPALPAGTTPTSGPSIPPSHVPRERPSNPVLPSTAPAPASAHSQNRSANSRSPRHLLRRFA